MARATQEKPLITILSIDGGGMRGIIPAKILCKLEEVLQELDGKGARISDYFDIIAGTSTGSLIAALLVAPEKGSNRPPTAPQILRFYEDDGPVIFSKESELARQISLQEGEEAPEAGWWKNLFQCTGKFVKKGVKKIIDPIYDRKHLEMKVTELLGELKLSNTLKHVVIPAFDMKAKSPVVFSSKYAAKRHLDFTLADAVIGSSAAPYYFPSHQFSVRGQSHELIDGGIAANNPVLLAIGEAKEAQKEKNKNNPESTSFGHYRILSLGTGIVDGKSIPGLLMGRGGILDLFVNSDGGAPPLVDMMFRANSITTDMYTSSMLGTFNHFPYYLRIQEYELQKELDVMNVTSPEIFKELQQVGLDLMQKPVSVANACTGLQEELKGPNVPANNGDALVKFAHMLARDKKRST